MESEQVLSKNILHFSKFFRVGFAECISERIFDSYMCLWEETAMLNVLLAAYNSQRYLREQLDSLFAQDYQDFQILIRDGGSSDDTVDIIQQYQSLYPGKIVFLGSHKAGAVENFSALLNACSAELVMFCDHDDVWVPGKISMTLGKYRELEKKCGVETPILIFTDACITDQKLKVMDPSLFHYQHLDTVHLSLNRLILQNVPSGNTMLVNRALIDLAMPIPPDAVMHDHWLALTTAAFGNFGLLKESTLYYRQHNSNVFGASEYSFLNIMKKIRAGSENIRTRFDRNIRQAAAFSRKYKLRLRPDEREMMSALEHWDEYGSWKKRKILLKYNILKSGFFRNLGTFFLI